MDWRSFSGRTSSVLLFALALAAAALCSLRAESLLTAGFEPTSQTERRWYAWATAPELEREALIRALRGLSEDAEGEPVRLEAPAGLRQDLVDVVAHYFLPRAEVEWTEGGGEAVLSEGRDSAGPGPADVVLFVSSVLVTLLFGLCWLPPPFRAVDLAAAWTFGFSVCLCLGGVLASLGLPIGRVTALPVGLMALALVSWHWRRIAEPLRSLSASRPPSTASTVELTLQGLCCSAWALVAWKVVLAPLWSWDHWAIWGYKSRLLLDWGALPILGERAIAAPQYPLGLPAAWNLMTVGAPLEVWHAKNLHLLAVTATGLLAGELARRLGAPRPSALVAVLACWLLPLAWSTEGLGLAEVFLAQTLLLAACSIVARAGEPKRVGVTALSLTAMAFLKDEGLTLALLLLVAWVLLRAEARWKGAASALAGIALARILAPPGGTPFAGGDWRGRLSARLADPFEVLGPVARELLRWEVFGLWLVVPVALCAACVLWRRSRNARPALLLTVALAQLFAYVLIYFLTYLEPEAHVVSSLARIASALEPLALAATVGLLAGLHSHEGDDSLLE